jgi:triphosphoribosyl-dephospho-CoA synthase
VALSLAVPGEEKAPPGADALFAWAAGEVARALPGARPLAAGADALGPFALWAAADAPAAAKARCVAIEASRPAARLLDLDVYAPDGAAVDRAALRLPARRCLRCDEPARECIALRRHGSAELAARARELLAGEGLERLAAALVEGLRRELHLTPKPGLVDLEDRGSHPDLSLELMDRSIELVGGYLDELCASVAGGEPLALQVAIARRAEQRMLERLGTNTHKGAIFVGGLLVVARHRAGADDEAALRPALSAVAREVAAATAPRGTHGDDARRRFRVGGILAEAAAGLPSVFDVAVPAFRAAAARGADPATASFSMLAGLMQAVEDTTALHRCGLEGLARLREDGARLERLVADGAHLPFLRERNAHYRRMNLTMGGVADLLGAALGWLVYVDELDTDTATG